MAEQDRLGAAIATISERYLGKVLEANDKPGILKWSLRLADYSTRLAAQVAPPLEPTEAADTDPGEALASDPQVALAQLLVAVGHPITFNAQGETIAIDGASVVTDASPEQNAQLALLGFFGSPDLGMEGADYSLFEKYYQRTAGTQAGWEPKPEYWVKGTWQAYLSTL